MTYANRVGQKLHDEHMATLALLERLERFMTKGKPPATVDSATDNSSLISSLLF